VTRGTLVVVGDLLLDKEILGTVDRLCPEAPVPVLAQTSTLDRPGGAGLAASLLAASAGDREVVLVAGVSGDEAGDRLRDLVARAGVRLVAVESDGPTVERIRLRAGEHLLLRLDRGDGPTRVGRAPADAVAAVHAADAVLVSDYARGMAGQPQLRTALTGRAHCAPVVWDPDPHGEPPVPATRLVTPTRAGSAAFLAAALAATAKRDAALAAAAKRDGGPAVVPRPERQGLGNGRHRRTGARPEPATAELAAVAGTAVRLRRIWGAGAVALTAAGRGVVVSDGVNPPLLVPAPFPAGGDGCGAGDRFATAAVTALADGGSVLDAVAEALAAATAYVAAGGVLAVHPELHTPAVSQMVELQSGGR
jgi:bifunctional ADP-heptose synthase (sugar kinase/adenylyltransferase)